MWDTENQPALSNAEDELIRQFEKNSLNVTVKRVVKNFDDYMATIKLAASSSDAPDVFQGNEGCGRPGAGEGAPDRCPWTC